MLCHPERKKRFCHPERKKRFCHPERSEGSQVLKDEKKYKYIIICDIILVVC